MGLAQDPLRALGPSLFLSTLEHLPLADLGRAQRVCRGWQAVFDGHPRQIWRPIVRGAADEELVYELDNQERIKAVDWKAALSRRSELLLKPGKDDVKLTNNWANGRFKETWTSTGDNQVWRFKIDRESGTMISTARSLDTDENDRDGPGLTVVDLDTSERLFRIMGVEPYAHLEFARGFVVFNHEPRGTRATLQVWRTQAAIDRSSHASPIGRSALTRCSQFEHGQWTPTTPAAPLPRGHLAHYRTITPALPCLAFRARIDGEFTPTPRPVLAAAGRRRAYVWDLEKGTLLEEYDTEEELREGLHYVELDDDYLFVCGENQIFVFARSNCRLVVAFPDINNYSAADTAVFYRRTRRQEGAARPDGMLHVFGDEMVWLQRDHTLVEDTEFNNVLHAGVLQYANAQRGMAGFHIPIGFIACHFTKTNLVLATIAGAVFIVRDYRATLARVALVDSTQAKLALLRAQTFYLGLDDPVCQLTTWMDRLALVTDDNVLFLDSRSLPPAPLADSAAPPVPGREQHVARIMSPCSTFWLPSSDLSALQMDRHGVYMVDVSRLSAGLPFPPDGVFAEPRPEHALAGSGVCVKMWDLRNDFAHAMEWAAGDAPAEYGPGARLRAGGWTMGDDDDDDDDYDPDGLDEYDDDDDDVDMDAEDDDVAEDADGMVWDGLSGSTGSAHATLGHALLVGHASGHGVVSWDLTDELADEETPDPEERMGGDLDIPEDDAEGRSECRTE